MLTIPSTAVPERKVPVIVRPGAYTVYFERTSGLTFIHCDIHGRWTKDTKTRLSADWKALRDIHEGSPIYALHTPNDTKHEKFLLMMGFRYAASFTGTDGSPHDIYEI